MKNDFQKMTLVGAILLLAPSLASAHVLPDGSHGLQQGFLHPLSGGDHLLAMLAVGLWAAQQQGRAVWLIPAAFVSLMTVGGALGLAGVLLPGVELGIALSLLVLGLLIATAARFTPSLSMALVGFFALFHGCAHGAEMPGSASAGLFSLGFIAATLLLHGAGLLAGFGLQRAAQMRWVRFAGAAIAVCAFYFLAA